MLRLMAASRFEAEWAAIQQLHREAGTPLPADDADRVAAWLKRNPELFHLFEDDGRVSGCASLIPIYRESYCRRVAGGTAETADLAPEEILPMAEYAAAQWDGVWMWIERFVAATVTARQKLGAHVYHWLAGVHLKGLLVTTADPDGEADCRWLGLVERRAVAGGFPTTRKLWYADEQTVGPTRDQPFGPPTPVRCLFLMVRERFGPPPQRLGLTPTERRIARLFYGEDREAAQIAGLLGMKPGTVKTHLQRIRRKSEPIVGSRLSRRIAVYLAERPGEMVEGER